MPSSRGCRRGALDARPRSGAPSRARAASLLRDRAADRRHRRVGVLEDLLLAVLGAHRPTVDRSFARGRVLGVGADAVAQAAAVVAGHVRLHRRLGTAGMIYGALVFAVGLARQRRCAGAARARRPVSARGRRRRRALQPHGHAAVRRVPRARVRVSQPARAAQALDHRRDGGALRRRARSRGTGQHARSICCCGCRRFSRCSSSILRRGGACTSFPLVSAALIVVAFFKVPLARGARVARDRRGAAAAICLSSRVCSMISSRIWTEGWPATA